MVIHNVDALLDGCDVLLQESRPYIIQNTEEYKSEMMSVPVASQEQI